VRQSPLFTKIHVDLECLKHQAEVEQIGVFEWWRQNPSFHIESRARWVTLWLLSIVQAPTNPVSVTKTTLKHNSLGTEFRQGPTSTSLSSQLISADLVGQSPGQKMRDIIVKKCEIAHESVYKCEIALDPSIRVCPVSKCEKELVINAI
jgi:hypothetical protein